MKPKYRIVAVVAALFAFTTVLPAREINVEQNVENLDITGFDGIVTRNDLKSSRTYISGKGNSLNPVLDIHVTKADSWNVRVETPGKNYDRLFSVSKSGSKLVFTVGQFRIRKRTGKEMLLRDVDGEEFLISVPGDDVRIAVYVSIPAISSVDLSNFRSEVSFSGKFIGRSLDFKCSGMCTARGLEGEWESSGLNFSGLSSVRNFNIKTSSMTFCTNGATSVKNMVFASEEMNLTLSGTSSASSIDIEAGTLALNLSGSTILKPSTLSVANFRLNAAGVSTYSATRAKVTGKASVMVSGSSSVVLDGKFNFVEARMSGVSNLTMSGNGEEMAISGTGSSSVRAKDLVMKNVTADMSGVSHCSITVLESLEKKTSYSATVEYFGNPKSVTEK